MLVDSIVDKKGSNIILLDIRDQATFADYFLICNGENTRQLDAIAEEVAFNAKRQVDNTSVDIEGSSSSGWILIDIGDLVVHVFSPDKRDFYNIEDIWNDAYVVMRMH